MHDSLMPGSFYMLQCVTQLQGETAQQGLALKHPLALGILQDTQGWQTSHLEAAMVFPQVMLACLCYCF